MALFEEARLEWNGKQVVIPAGGRMRAIAVIEQHITVWELSRQQQSGDYKLSQIAAAYAALLCFAGERVTEEEVYDVIFPRADGEKLLRVSGALNALLMLMVPASVRAKPAAEGAPAGKPQPQTAA